jgi:hypothetical protein
MNATQLIDAIGDVNDKYLEELIDHAEHHSPKTGYSGSRKVFQTALIAAVIASLFALMCAGAYALNVFGIKDLIVGKTQDEIYLSRQGIADSPEFLANQEFNEFYDDYVANDYYGDQVPQEQDQWMEQHSRIYFCYTQRLKDKILEIADKYNLKLADEYYEDSNAQWLYAVMGMDDFMLDDSFDDPKAEFIAYDNGAFLLQGTWGTANDNLYMDVNLLRTMKGYLSQGTMSFSDDQPMEQRSYITADGADVTIITGQQKLSVFTTEGEVPKQSNIYIVYDGTDAFVTVSFNSLNSKESFSEDEINSLADDIDFIALGKSSNVDLTIGKNRPADDSHDQSQWFADNLSELGRWIESDDGLEYKVDSIDLSTNIYDQGWNVEQFSRESNGLINGAIYNYPDWVNAETGEMAAGMRLLTVGLTVHNTNSTDDTSNQTLNNTGLNNFPNSLLSLYADGISFSAYGWSGENPIPGQTAFVHIEPGETVSYKLAYIIDDQLPANLEGVYLIAPDFSLPLEGLK